MNDKSIEGIVDIGRKPVVERRATARGRLVLKADTKSAIVQGEIKKGDVLEASTIAVVQAVKETPRIVPHCHPVPLEGTEVNWRWNNNDLWCTVSVSAHYKTGIEMEALTGASVAALTLYDMCKSVSKAMVIESIKLIEKTGGKSGDYHADAG